MINIETLCFAAAGYLCGSLLFARITAALLGRGDITKDSKDGNPGTANAFMYGGPLCGVLTLIGDVAKGFLPVFLYLRFCSIPGAPGIALVMAAPVIGHIFPLYYHFKGGKGIAVSFGVLAAFLPYVAPIGVLAAFFIFFSVVLRISPHFYRTLLTYGCSAAAMFLLHLPAGICTGFLVTAVLVFLRLRLSSEERERIQVGLLWMH